jgi:hypothetical protein
MAAVRANGIKGKIDIRAYSHFSKLSDVDEYALMSTGIILHSFRGSFFLPLHYFYLHFLFSCFFLSIGNYFFWRNLLETIETLNIAFNLFIIKN